MTMLRFRSNDHMSLLHCPLMFPGHATPEGTARYHDRFPQLRDAKHFRRPEHVPGVDELWLSSIGLGTYLGEPDDAADRNYIEAAATALISGINVLDTAINYRHQRSERNLGAALRQRIESGDAHRDEILVCTKAGYLSFDSNLPADPRAYFTREYVESGILDPQQLVGGSIAWLRPISKTRSSVQRGILASKPSMCSTCTIRNRNWRRFPARLFASASKTHSRCWRIWSGR